MCRCARTLLLLLSCCGAPDMEALADSAEEDESTDLSSLPTVEITGTRLKHTDAQTSSPVDVISREDLAFSGKQTLSDVVRSISADNNGSIGLGNVSGFAMGSSGVALRGLAVNTTLVLINGRRMTSYGLADDGQRTFVNLSDLPLDIVDRIEILKDGGSAIYGSDAIAGVVNIILRSSFTGASAQLSYGITEYGDGQTPRISATVGRGELERDGYNAFIHVEASHKGAMYARDRGGRKWIGTGDLRPYGYAFAAGGSGPNIGGWFDNSTGLSLANRYGAVSAAGLSIPQWQQLPKCDSSIDLPVGLGGCPWDRVKETGVIFPRENKVDAYLRGSLRVSDAFNPYVEFGVFRSDVKSAWVFGPTSANEPWVDPATDSVVSNATLDLPADHPDNPLGADAMLTYLFAEAGSRTFEHDSVAYRALVGTSGKLGDWEYDGGVLYAHNTTQRTISGFIRNSVFQSGLNGTGSYGYYRLGLNSGLNSSAFMQALAPELSTDNTSSLTLVDLKANRVLWDLPGGPLGLSLGGELRRETLAAPPMPYTDVGDIIGWSYYAYRGELKVGSMFVEIDAPVAPGLSVDVAGRVDKVWDVGTAGTPKVGFRWVAWGPLMFRGTYSQGFRAPNPAEQGKDNQFAGTLDMTGNGFLGVFRNTSNPDLKPEKSRMSTLGAVLRPWPQGSLGVNFWWLRRTDEINSVDPFAILAGASGWPHAHVVRDPAGDVLEVSTPFENNSRSRLRGVDVDLSQRLESAGFGGFSAKLNWSYLASYRKTFTGGVTYEYAGTHGPMVVSGNTGTPKHRANVTLAWENTLASLSAFVNFVDGFVNKDNRDAACVNTFADGSPAPRGCHIASFTTVDLRAAYKPVRGFNVFLAVNNLFDRIAPLDPAAYINLNFDPSLHLDGAIGRSFNVGLRYEIP